MPYIPTDLVSKGSWKGGTKLVSFQSGHSNLFVERAGQLPASDSLSRIYDFARMIWKSDDTASSFRGLHESPLLLPGLLTVATSGKWFKFKRLTVKRVP